jgi:GSH-dependent disulfide-bond oxidoreductase
MTLELYTANTPNSQRVTVVLEELGVPYTQRKVDIFAGEARSAEFLKVNPNGLLPVIIDPQGPDRRSITLTQSWAICLYLADKTGRLIPADPVGRLRVVESLFAVAADVMMVHTTHNTLNRFVPEKVPSIIGYYEQRVAAALQNLDRQLGEREYLAGDLSVTDFAFYPVYNRRRELVEQHRDKLSHLARWGAQMDARPACKRGVELTR